MLLLGTEHLGSWDGNDGRPDIMCAERQAELDRLVDAFATWRPTKVGLEVLASKQAQLDAMYSDYARAAAGGGVGKRNEIEQIGFRLAVRAGATVHAIDADWMLMHDGVEDYFARHPDERPAGPLSADGTATVKRLAQLRASMPLDQFLMLLNTDADAYRFNDREYLDHALTIGAGDNWGGVDLVASWYRRNLRIFANLLTMCGEGDDDRIVVVIGLAHTASLRAFLDASSRLQHVSPADVVPAR